jgi:hypothetical protein
MYSKTVLGLGGLRFPAHAHTMTTHSEAKQYTDKSGVILLVL